GITGIGRHHWKQPVATSCRGNLGHESVQPASKVTCCQNTPHHVCFAEARRKEILSRRLIRQRAILVAEIELPSFRSHEVGKFSVSSVACVVQNQAEGKCGL